MSELTTVIVIGFAVGFTTELIGLPFDRWTSLDTRAIKQFLSAPIGALIAYLLGVTGIWNIVVDGVAASFVSLVILNWMNRPVQIQQVVSGRAPRL
jgi:hypothetical protein